MPDDYIERQWFRYRDEVMEPGVAKEQITECKCAFFAGAAMMLFVIAGDAEEEPTDADDERLASIQRELLRYTNRPARERME